jgi:hypothetical protein
LTVALSESITPIQVTELQELAKHRLPADILLDMKKVVAEVGRHNMTEVLAAKVVVDGAARTLADTELKMAARTEEVEDMERVTDNRLEIMVVVITRKPNLALITSKGRAGTTSKIKVVGIIRAADTVSLRRETIRMGNKAAMILSLVLEVQVR